MDQKQIAEIWWAAKSGILDFYELEPKLGPWDEKSYPLVRLPWATWPDGTKGWWFVCPCGGEDHAAYLPLVNNGRSMELGQVLTCFVTNQQWAIRHPDPEKEIQKEEKMYLDLIEKAKTIVPKVLARRGMNEETLHFLKDTHGIDREIVMELCR